MFERSRARERVVAICHESSVIKAARMNLWIFRLDTF